MKEAEEPLKQGKQTAAQPEAKAKITLNDCLACSGCVTTAESLLVEQMSIAEFIRKVFLVVTADERAKSGDVH